MDMDQIEQIAKALHDAWCEYKSREHWTFGPKDEAKKTHPHLLAWENLPDEEPRNQDRFQAAVLLQRWSETFQPVTPEMIHEAWRLWECLHGNRHRHDLPYLHPESHGGRSGPQEHELQAAKVNEILGRLAPSSPSAGAAPFNPGAPMSEADLAAAYDDPEWAAFENNCAKASR